MTSSLKPPELDRKKSGGGSPRADKQKEHSATIRSKEECSGLQKALYLWLRVISAILVGVIT